MNIKIIATFAAVAALAMGIRLVAAEPEHDDGRGTATAEKTLVLQTTCPVMAGKINKKLYVDHDGQRIYVCCQGCIAPLRKDFAKYAKKIEAAGETVAKLQTTCPVMGGKINKKLYVDHDGQRVYVCCQGCIDTVRKDPAKYIEKLAGKGEVPVAAPQAVEDR
ncbi:MAG: hypothetical protein RRC34_10145 [Lentisphaeria bacterium]|nr:hypothetical protein [Lentisphaeria bacterium]